MILREKNISARPVDLTKWVYGNVKQLILDNELPGETQINIDDMSKQLQVSRTPVREALLLRNEGLVRIQPHVGCFVCNITKDEFREVFQLRSVIECYAASRVAEQMSDDDLRRWMECVEKSEAAVLDGNLEEFNNMEILLHNNLIDSLQNKRISSVMETIADSIYRERKIAMDSEENVQQSVQEHRAIAMRSPEKAERAMKMHIRNVERRIEKIVFGD